VIDRTSDLNGREKHVIAKSGEDVIHFLLPVQLHDDREHKQGMLVPTPSTSPHTLLSKQLYYDRTRCDSLPVPS
jgi:hypothetical protein